MKTVLSFPLLLLLKKLHLCPAKSFPCTTTIFSSPFFLVCEQEVINWLIEIEMPEEYPLVTLGNL